MRKRNAFTLTELLVVLGCIAVLISLLLPVAAKARSVSRTTTCLSNLRQLGNAWSMYVYDNRGALIKYTWNTPQSYGTYWFGILDANGVRGEALMCPAADEPQLNSQRRGYGTAQSAWTGRLGPVGSAIRFSATQYRDGSYGYNRYLNAKNGFGPRGQGSNILSITTPLSEVPTFMDCVYADVQPPAAASAATLSVPPDLTGKAATPGAAEHWKLLIARHGPAINIAMADGSARTVPLADLYELTWETGWQKFQLTLP